MTTDAFFNAFCSNLIQRTQVEENPRVRSLFDYLARLRARTLVLEHDYTDGDYLDDYARYYVKSFANYGRRCRRLHAFKVKIGEEEFLSEVTSPKGPRYKLRRGYLGFIVVRPLPDPRAIVGRTVIATYPSDGKRHFPATHDYTAHIAGWPFRVRSLAFQEQDAVLAACATVALWSAAHQAAAVFRTPRHSPAEITRLANNARMERRELPSSGLRVDQMCHVIRALGLEPEVIDCGPDTPVVSLVYGYLQMGIPVILFAEIEGNGAHAITLNGFKLHSDRVLQREAESIGTPPMQRIGLRIAELYGHDDQICPFANMRVLAVPPAELAAVADRTDDESGGTPARGRDAAAGVAGAAAGGNKAAPEATCCAPQQPNDLPRVYFEGHWTWPNSAVPRRLTPRRLVVPVYHKIRLTYFDLQPTLDRFVQATHITVRELWEHEWDVRLSETTEWLRWLRTSNSNFPPSVVQRNLLRQLPRFLWRAILRTRAGEPLVEIIFDATAIGNSFSVLEILFYEDQFRDTLRGLLARPEAEGVLRGAFGVPMDAFLRDPENGLV